MLIEKYGRGKVFLACYLLFAVILIAEAAILHSAYNSLTYKGVRLTVRAVGGGGVTMADRNGGELTASYHMQHRFEGSVIIRYLSYTILCDYDLYEKTYTFSDGSTSAVSTMTIVTNGAPSPGYDLTGLQQEEMRLADRLRDYYYDYKIPAGFIGLTVAGLLILLLAHSLFFYTDTFWVLQTFLTVRGGEPTGYYLFTSRLSSVIIAGAVYAGFIIFANS